MKSVPITNILTGITQLSWNVETDQMIFTGFNNSGYDTFTIYNPKKYLDIPIDLIDANWLNQLTTSENIVEKEIFDYSKIDNSDYSNYDFTQINSNRDKSLDKNNKQGSFDDDLNKFDSTKPLKILKYKTRFTLDYANVDYGYNSVRGSTGLVNILFSDILGNHKILINTEMQIKIKSSDYLIKYYNLSKRTDWRYTFYHYGQEYYDFQDIQMSNGQMVTDLFPTIRYQYLGLSIDPRFCYQ